MSGNSVSSRERLEHSARFSARYKAPTPLQRRSALLRRLFIGFCVAVFLVYCWASVAFQNRIGVPDYRLTKVDVLGGAARARWDGDGDFRFQRLIALENRGYRLPVDMVVKDADGEPISAERRLQGADFEYFVRNAPDNAGLVMELRDPVDIENTAALGYHLRDAIYDPTHPDDLPLVSSGEPFNQALMAKLRSLGIRTVTVVGAASTIGFDIGTSIMLLVIFLGLTAALKPVLWEPFQALIEKRHKELEIGAEAARQNQIEEAKLEADSKRQLGKLMQEMQAKRMRIQQETARETGEIIKEAKSREKTERHGELQRINAEARLAGKQLHDEVPEMAEAIAAAVLRRRD